jgi:hypothetical protein
MEQFIPKPSVCNYRPAMPAPRAVPNYLSSIADEISVEERRPMIPSASLPDPNMTEGRVAKLRVVLRRERVSPEAADAFIGWAREDRSLRRLGALEKSLEGIGDVRLELGRWMDPECMERMVARALGGSPSALIEWGEEMRRALQHLLELHHTFDTSGVPEAVFAHLVAWVFEGGTVNEERFGRLAGFADSLDSLPFSAASKSRHWKAFLDSTYSGSSPGWDACRDWLNHLERVGARIG